MSVACEEHRLGNKYEKKPSKRTQKRKGLLQTPVPFHERNRKFQSIGRLSSPGQVIDIMIMSGQPKIASQHGECEDRGQCTGWTMPFCTKMQTDERTAALKVGCAHQQSSLVKPRTIRTTGDGVRAQDTASSRHGGAIRDCDSMHSACTAANQTDPDTEKETGGIYGSWNRFVLHRFLGLNAWP